MLLVCADELEGNGVRLRLYRSEKFKKERMIGENYVAFSSIPFDQGAAAHSIWIKLQPRLNINIIVRIEFLLFGPSLLLTTLHVRNKRLTVH